MNAKRAVGLMGKYLLVILVSLMIIVPILIFLIASFKTNQDFATSSLFTLPKTYILDNYKMVIEKGNFLLAIKNTFIILVFSILLNIVLGSTFAYVLARFDFKFKGIILLLMMGARVIPGITTQVATFTIISKLGLYNTLGAPILLYAGADIVQVILYMEFVRNTPESLDESALIDGASYYRIFSSIIFPLLMPATITTVILKMVSVYNDMYIPYLYMPKARLAVVSTSLMKFCGSNYGAQVTAMGAAFITVMIPMFVLYICAQKKLFGGITAGAVKE